ncbi:MAG: hypothetical protein US11_C0008G0017 [Candidatus Roizmanbacteria bacterium GW2011_GWA2_36_23]|uniref:Uncharacterized protein n=1 Tax=Candidatus Roizmanbacteria bacterium GW2011_GWA2_36_23 TaxID=1618480 RepID=A0A0G0EK43_9BACT|nr:MAG: hypothetical protein US11_C0008G0017 [Candidatus Roizmanbacteria bacterium GW2011_GWA2_36_23]
MTGYFNAPYIFLKFYDPEAICPNCQIGGIDKIDSNKKQLFAFRVEEVDKIYNRNFIKKKIIYYPDGKEAFYIGVFN